MKIGSLVQWIGGESNNPYIAWLPYKDQICTIRELLVCPMTKEPLLRVEEGCFGYAKGVELASEYDFWREIQPPEEDTAVEEVNNIIEESLLQPI